MKKQFLKISLGLFLLSSVAISSIPLFSSPAPPANTGAGWTMVVYGCEGVPISTWCRCEEKIPCAGCEIGDQHDCEPFEQPE